MKYTTETDDEAEHRRYLAGPRALAALWNFSEALRAKVKYSEEQSPQGGWHEVQELFIVHCGEVLEESGEL